MAAPLTLMTSVFADGGRVSRFGEFVVCRLHGGSFTVTSLEFLPIRMWANARMSTGNAMRDRTLFIDRFQTVLARKGGGIATRGNRDGLKRLADGIREMGMTISEWSVPHDLDACVVAVRRPQPMEDPAA